ncbi:MAG: hypothetical protein HYW05_02990 [Candidatus Diapherotrites archaeon]|nr:hypothetical protein [Candidatus Diapherotrites archaeon]
MIIDLVFYSDLQSLKRHAKLLGIDAIIIAQSFKSQRDIDSLRAEIKKSKFPFYICHLLGEPNQNDAKLFRGKADFIAVIGGSANANKFAVSSNFVDFLIAPAGYGKNEFDTAIAQIASDNQKPIAIPFSQFLNSGGFQRSMLFKNYLFAVKIMKKFRLNALFFSGAKKEGELRAPQDFSAFANLLGFSKEQGGRFIGRYAETILQKVGK